MNAAEMLSYFLWHKQTKLPHGAITGKISEGFKIDVNSEELMRFLFDFQDCMESYQEHRQKREDLKPQP